MINSIDIIPVPALTDNYIWLLVNTDNGQCVCVDPGDAKPVIRFLKKQHLTLSAILITHHHWDHINGTSELVKHYQVPVYGPANSSIPECSHPVSEGEQIELEALEVTFSIGAIPGHTLDHLFYYCEPWLFCGDTLFSIGCGRVFEGTPSQMRHSLSKLAQLPDATQLFCGHEYTLNNIRFAEQVDPSNNGLAGYKAHCEELRQLNKPTLPSSMAIEKLNNPFLRCDNPTIKNNVEQHCGHTLDSADQVFAALRDWKNNF